MNKEEIKEFIRWHEQRMIDLCYPAEIIAELRAARTKWLAGIK